MRTATADPAPTTTAPTTTAAATPVSCPLIPGRPHTENGIAEDGSPHWHVTFAVADRDASAASAERLGAFVTATEENDWTRSASVRDPWGAVFTLSELTAG